MFGLQYSGREGQSAASRASREACALQRDDAMRFKRRCATGRTSGTARPLNTAIRRAETPARHRSVLPCDPRSMSRLSASLGRAPGPGHPLFWVVQGLSWLVLHTSFIIPLYAIAVANGAPTDGIATKFGLGALAGLAVSSVMAVIYARLPVRYTQGTSAVGTVLVISFLGALLWSWVQTRIVQTSGAVVLLRPEFGSSQYTGMIIQLTRSFLILGLWSAIFIVLLLSYRVRVTSAEALRSAQRANEAQLQLLRAQLNPHFLFNSLNSVVALIEAEPSRAKDMVRNLSSLLRSALANSDGVETTVGDELEFVDAYLSCERVRYEDRLQVTVTVPDSLKNQPLPTMSLQPLVENAIKHGMKGRDPLYLRIEGKEARGEVEIAVINSRPSEEVRRSAGTGTGLRNVRTRVEMMFPESGEVSLHQEDRWSTATIRYRCPDADERRV